MKISKQSGFTLIELLVVIAIIGILSAVVLGSLNDARQSAKDAAIAQQMNALENVMELNALETRGGRPGYASEPRSVWVKNASLTSGPGSSRPSCDTVALNGLSTKNEADFRKLCNAIQDNAEYRGEYFMLLRWFNTHPAYGPHYSLLARTAGDKIWCIGSSGNKYVGPQNPGTGAYTGPGCHLNP